MRRKEALDAWAGKLTKARSMAKSFKVKSMMNAKVLRRVAKQVRVLSVRPSYYDDQWENQNEYSMMINGRIKTNMCLSVCTRVCVLNDFFVAVAVALMLSLEAYSLD